MARNFTVKDEVAAYWSARAAGFDASPGHGMTAPGERAAWLALLRAELGLLAGRRVLELASGTGEFTRVLVDAGAEVTGLDLSEAMLARARRKLAADGRRVRLFLGDAEATGEPTGRYDAVVCRHLVWTLPEPRVAAADWLRVLRPGGRLMVIDGDWVRLPLWGRVRRALGHGLERLLRWPVEPIDWAAHARIMAQVHFRDGLRPEPLAALLREAGFADVRIGSIAPIRRLQRRGAGFPRSLKVGVYRDFFLTAVRPGEGGVVEAGRG